MAFHTDLEGERRFNRVDSDNTAKAYMKYDIENVGRGLDILTSVHLAAKKPYDHLASKRKAAEFIMGPYDEGSLKRRTSWSWRMQS